VNILYHKVLFLNASKFRFFFWIMKIQEE
jgi:hypothetical protein